MTGVPTGHIVLDASVWVSRLVSQDIFYQKVRAWMETLRAGGVIFLSPSILLPEVAGAISRRTGDPQIAKEVVESLQSLPDLRLVELDRSMIQRAVFLACELGLRGADSIYVAVAAQLNLPLATLDVDQKDRAVGKIAIHDLGSQD